MSEQSFIVRISERYDTADRVAIGEAIVELVKSRTRSGLDKNNRPFPSYKPSYTGSLEFKLGNKRKDRVDLQLSGDMLIGLELIDHGKGYVKVGFPAGTEDGDKAKWNAEKGRDILGIMPLDLDRILSRFPLSQLGREEFTITRTFAEEFLRTLFGR